MTPQKIKKWAYQIDRTLSYLKFNIVPLRQKVMESDDSSLMWDYEPEKTNEPGDARGCSGAGGRKPAGMTDNVNRVEKQLLVQHLSIPQMCWTLLVL